MPSSLGLCSCPVSDPSAEQACKSSWLCPALPTLPQMPQTPAHRAHPAGGVQELGWAGTCLFTLPELMGCKSPRTSLPRAARLLARHPPPALRAAQL